MPFPDCYINIYDLPDHQPLLLDGNNKFVRPENGAIIVPHGESLSANCSTSDFLERVNGNPCKSLKMRCDNSKFIANGREIKPEQLRCEEQVEPVVKPVDIACHVQGSEYYDSGFWVGPQFIPIIRACYNPDLMATHWVEYTILAGNSKSQKRPKVPFTQSTKGIIKPSIE